MDSPFIQKLGFKKLIDSIALQSQSENDIVARGAAFVLKNIAHKEDLINGLEQGQDLDKYQEDISLLMNQLFPPSLLNNEIKIAVSPFDDHILFRSDRFKSIFGTEGNVSFGSVKEYKEQELYYIVSCALILKTYYDVDINLSMSHFCDVRDDDGILRHYRALMNGEFYEVTPVGTPPEINEKEIHNLLHSGNNIELWKTYFPPQSWLINGFGIINLYDATKEVALSRFKDLLIVKNQYKHHDRHNDELIEVLRSFLLIPDLEIDLLLYDENKQHLIKLEESQPCIGLPNQDECDSDELFCHNSRKHLFEHKQNLILANVSDLKDQQDTLGIIKGLLNLGYQSYMAAPIVDGDKTIGILEFASKKPYQFNNIFEKQLETIIPVATSAMKAYLDGYSNKLSAIIQTECTAIHPSVEWRFFEEAEHFLETTERGEEISFDEIKFDNLYALYGQIDISGSSIARNDAIAQDLSTQLSMVMEILEMAQAKVEMPLIESLSFQTHMMIEQINSDLAAGIEQEVIAFLKNDITPLLNELSEMDEHIEKSVEQYKKKIHPRLGIIYEARQDYDKTLEIIGQNFASSIDRKQKAAQKIYPHYFERYKTDGVEHNMFIGQSLAPKKPFNKLYLRNLHLWQLKALCEMEREHHALKKSLPLPLDVASLIMIYSSPLSIRYRMDEKQFDVDGAYNARYEIIKKRIDKAHIINTDERLTQPGKMVIVFTQQSDLEEYKTHINYLIYAGLLKNDMEIVQIENLQGVVGLRAIRVSVDYSSRIETDEVVMEGEKISLLKV